MQLDGGRDTHRIGLAEGRSTRIPRFGTARPGGPPGGGGGGGGGLGGGGGARGRGPAPRGG
ncbi:esterase, partial [Pseudomonas aeruginosa]